MFRKSRTSSVALLFAPWKDEYFLGVMNDLRDLFMNSLLSLSNVISDFALAMRWKTTGTYLLHTNCKTVLGTAFIPSIEMGCNCIKKKTIMNYKIYKEVILFHSILILFYRKTCFKWHNMFIRESGDNDFDKALHRRKHVTLSINTCTYDLSNLINSFQN